MYIRGNGISSTATVFAISDVCPFCGSKGTFEKLGHETTLSSNFTFSIQACPYHKCKGVLVVVYEGGKMVKTYPGLGRGINTENVPDRIKAAFQEGVVCFASNCFISAAIMIRKTLEEICVDKGVTKGDLKTKIQNLSKQVIISPELLEGMDELRLLGNDAAHINAMAFEEIDSEELILSIDITQEIIRAIYQHQNMLDRLRSRKKLAAGVPPITP